MGLWSRLWNRSSAKPEIRAGYDIARTTDFNRKHWVNADSLNAVSQLTPAVRETIRKRARYEVMNNSYAAGMIRTLVTDTIGTGPRLQILTDNDQFNESVEDLFRIWSMSVNWPMLCRIMVGVRYVAGECFAVFRDNKTLGAQGYPITLDLRLIEPDQVTDGYGGTMLRQTGDDGIVCDSDGDVVAYKILRYHPGDNRAVMLKQSLTPDEVPVRDVLHWFEPQRPGQLRGVSPMAPSLDIFAQLRRFSSATLTAAEIAAMLAGVLETTDGLPGDPDDSPSLETFDTIELVKGTLITLPANRKATQFKPEHPTTTYDQFVSAKLREAGRVLNIPFGKMAGDHSRYNYSSGRMDDAPYWHDRDVERQQFEAMFLNRVLWRWMDFARFVIPELAMKGDRFWEIPHAWQYDAKPSSDPVKDASGDAQNLINGTDTLSAIAAREGTTVTALVKQRARDIRAFQQAGLPVPPWALGASVATASTGVQSQDNEAPQEQQSGPGGNGNGD